MTHVFSMSAASTLEVPMIDNRAARYAYICLEVEEETTHPQRGAETSTTAGQTPVSSIKIVELVECPDFKKKMTKKN